MKKIYFIFVMLFILFSDLQNFSQPAKTRINLQSKPNNVPVLITTLGHTGGISSIAYSKNGKLLVSAGERGIAIIWDVATRSELLRITASNESLVYVEFLDNDKRILTGDVKGIVRIWETTSGRMKLEKKGYVGVLSHNYIYGKPFAVSANGDIIFTTDKEGNAHFWNSRTGIEETSFHVSKEDIGYAAFSPDGKMILIGSMEGTKLFEISGKKQIWSIAEDHGPVKFLSNQFSVVTSSPGSIFVRDLKTGKATKVLPQGTVWSISVSSDNQYLLGGSYYNTASILWNLQTGEPVWEKFNVGVVLGTAFSPDKETFAMGDWGGFIQFWDINTLKSKQVLWGFTNKILDIGFRDESPYMIGFDSINSACLWRGSDTTDIQWFVGYREEITSGSLSPDGNLVLLGGENGLASLWNAKTGKLRFPLQGHTQYVAEAKFSSDGRFAFTTGGAGFKWNTETGKMETQFGASSLEKAILQITPSPDTKYVYTQGVFPLGNALKRFKFWDSATGNELPFMTKKLTDSDSSQSKTPIRISRDGRVLTTDCKQYPANQFTISPSTKIICNLQQYDSFGLSPDGTLLFAVEEGGKTVLVKNLQNPSQVKKFQHAKSVELVSITKDNRFLLTSSKQDNIAHLWNINSETEICNITTFKTGNWIIVGPDGRFDTDKSLDKIEGLHWALPDNPLKAVPLEIFMRQYYEPELLQRLLKCNSENNCEQEFKRLPSIAEINRVQPLISKPAVSVPKVDGTVDITVEVENITEEILRNNKKEKLSSGVYDLRLFRDGQLVGNSTPKDLLDKYIKDAPKLVDEGESLNTLINTPEDKAWREANDLSKVVKFDAKGKATYTFKNIKLPENGRKEIEFSVYAFNVDRVKSETKREVYPIEMPKLREGKTYLVSIGVNASENSQFRLIYTAAVAKNYLEVLAPRLGSAKQKVIEIPLISDYDQNTKETTENNATKPVIKAVFDLFNGNRTEISEDILKKIPNADQIEQLQPEDSLIIAYSGHGYRSQNGFFYLLPNDIGTKTIDSADPEVLQKLISSDEISLWMRDITAKEMIMIIDACNSEASVRAEGFKPGPMGSRGLGQLAFDKQMKILTATQAFNAAWQTCSLKQSLLSHALLEEGIKLQKADTIDPKLKLTLNEWFGYAETRVPELHVEVLSGKYDANCKTGATLNRLGTGGSSYQKPRLFDFTKNRADGFFINLP